MFPFARLYGLHHLMENNLITAEKSMFLSENIRTAVNSCYCDKLLVHTDAGTRLRVGVRGRVSEERSEGRRTTGRAEVLKAGLGTLYCIVLSFIENIKCM